MASRDTDQRTITVEDPRDPQRPAEMPEDTAREGVRVLPEDAAAPEDVRVEPGHAVGYAAVPDRADAAAETREAEESRPEPVGMLPGAELTTPVSPLWSGGAAHSLRDRFRELQLGFLDDPRSTAAEADSLVGEAIDSLRSAFAEHHRELRAWQDAGAEDTEQLRVAVRRYRDLLDRVLAL